MSRIGLTLAVACAAMTASSLALARGGGGGGGMGGGMGMGGMSSSRMSSEGMANTNGPDAADRDKGLQRAEDRQSQMAASHEKAVQKSHRKSHATNPMGQQQ
ncbi:MAG TPA: hypothetical protein VF816_02745 [Rhodocyclaceae bacterium]